MCAMLLTEMSVMQKLPGVVWLFMPSEDFSLLGLSFGFFCTTAYNGCEVSSVSSVEQKKTKNKKNNNNLN